MSSFNVTNSIYPEFFLNQVFHPSESLEVNKSNVLRILHLTRFFAKNAELAIREYKNNNINAFDPLVRDRCCQIHAMQILEIFKDESVRAEILGMESRIKAILREINKKVGRVPILKDERPLSQFVEDFKISIEISSKIQVLFYAYMLTTATTIHQPRYIDYQFLQIKLSKKLDIDTIKMIVSITRTALSKKSTQYIQEISGQMITLTPEQKGLLQSRLAFVKEFEVDGNIGIKGEARVTPLTTTAMFYNMQTVLLKMREDRMPILIKETRKDAIKPMGIYFCSRYSGGQFETVSAAELSPKTPVLVFKGEISEGSTFEQLIEQFQMTSVEDVVLANVTNIEQFVVNDDCTMLDKEAQHEIAAYKEKAVEYSKKAYKRILHAYPSTVESEGVA